jgi:undecaprenyl-diphosphatase
MGQTEPERRFRFLSAFSSDRLEFRLLCAFAAVASLALTFGWFAQQVIDGDTMAFDRKLLLLFRQSGNTAIGPVWLQEAARDVTGLGSIIVLGFITIAASGYLLIVRKRAAALLLLVAVVGGQILSTLLKTLVARSRPDIALDAPHVFTASFPSGHAMLSAVTYLTIGALLTRIETSKAARIYLMVLAIILTVTIGVSRVYLGVHWPTDVLGGWFIGSAWAVLCWVLALWLQRRGQVERPGESI